MGEEQNQITPFKGFRYNLSIAGDPAMLMAPPYDVIPPAMQEVLYHKSEYNVVRLILGKILDNDTDENNRYTRSAIYFEEWMEKGVLEREEKPAIYVYAQTYKAEGQIRTRSGFIARKKLEEFGGSVMPHEKTLSGPKADRLNLMRRCKCNFSPIFGLYSDTSKTTNRLLNEAMKNQPKIDIETDGGERNRLWVVTDPAWISELTEAMQEKKILIADGHHRYETALNYMKEAQSNGVDSEEVKYVMMYFTNTDSEGLTILPTHRTVHSLTDFKLEDFLKSVSKDFEVEEIQSPNGDRNSKTESALSESMKSSNRPVFGIYSGKGRYAILKYKDKSKEGALETLDVAILHNILLESVLGISLKEQVEQKKIRYSPDMKKAAESVDKGDSQIAFFLNATQIEQMQKVVDAGHKMPQKSTYFYPKLITGLVINPLF